MTRSLFVLLIATILFAAPVIAEVPRTVGVQGYLTDEDGVPVPDGQYTTIFMLYTAPEGGSILWET